MPKYFAYGSNMSPHQMHERCPSQKFFCVAELRGYKLAFTRFSNNRQCGVADIVAAATYSVWGAVFDLSDAHLLTLDRHEEVHAIPPAYVRLPVNVFAVDGQPINAMTYEVCQKSPDAHATSAAYLGLILEGARHWGLPQSYQDALTEMGTGAS